MTVNYGLSPSTIRRCSILTAPLSQSSSYTAMYEHSLHTIEFILQSWPGKWVVSELVGANQWNIQRFMLHPLVCVCLYSVAEQHSFNSFSFDQLFCVFVLWHNKYAALLTIPNESKINKRKTKTHKPTYHEVLTQNSKKKWRKLSTIEYDTFSDACIKSIRIHY